MQCIETRRNLTRCLSGCFALLCVVSLSPTLFADWREDAGYYKLIGFLGDSAPNGSSVPISIVEASNNQAYFPNVNSSEFNSEGDPLGTAVVFTDGSGGQNHGTTGHSDAQSSTFFGNTLSVAPGANNVTVYEANDYLADILGVTGSNSDPPQTQNFRVQNFSWVGTYATPGDGTPNPTTTELNNDREALRRFDFAINEHNITAVVGVNNGTGSLPHFFSHSYNSIAVGLSSGNHSTGLTHLANYGVGRSKPELVSATDFVSGATASVSSIATFLHSSDTVLGTDAAQSETMKAILLAGATKDQFLDWSQVDSSETWHPLDDTYGAGQVNVYNSYLATLGGQFAGDSATPTSVASHGWDYQTIQEGSGNELQYDFVIPTGSTAAELSVALTWNALTSSPFNSGDPVLADLALELVDSNGMTVDTDLANAFVEGLSDSDVDNVEHLYLTDLAAGTYTLKVSSSDGSADFGLAWRMSTLFDVASADFNDDGDTDGADFLAWQRGHGILINATHADGDADGDGDVDADDLTIYRNAAGTGPAFFNSSLQAVPEPAGYLLLAAGVLTALGFSRFHRYSMARA